MKKRKIAALAAILCLSSAIILSGCGSSGKDGGESGSGSPAEQRENVVESRETEQGEAQEAREMTQAGAEADVVKGYQFVDGYGICAPESPAFYQLSRSEGTGDGACFEVENGMAKLRLLGAVRQGQSMTVKYEIIDYSVKVLPEEETKKIREQEKENRKKQERGEPVEWDWSYICLDEEKGIYGRSEFETKLFENKKPGLYTGDARIYGTGMPAGGMTFRTGAVETGNETFFEEGALTRFFVKNMEDGGFTEKKPDGLYELKVDGFEKPLVFAFEKTPEYQSLEEIEGITVQDGFCVFARGKEEDGELTITVNTYSEDGFRLQPGRSEVRVMAGPKKDGKEEVEILNVERVLHTSVKENYQGLKAGSCTEFTCKLPEGMELRSVEFAPEEMAAVSDEVSPAIRVEIPEKDGVIGQKVEFRDAVVSLTAVHRTEERQEMGTDEAGKTVMKPVLRIDASASSTNPALEFYLAGGYTGEETERPVYYNGGITPIIKDGEGGRMEGFHIVYEEGGGEVTFYLASPCYKLVKRLEFPVLLQ